MSSLCSIDPLFQGLPEVTPRRPGIGTPFEENGLSPHQGPLPAPLDDPAVVLNISDNARDALAHVHVASDSANSISAEMPDGPQPQAASADSGQSQPPVQQTETNSTQAGSSMLADSVLSSGTRVTVYKSAEQNKSTGYNKIMVDIFQADGLAQTLEVTQNTIISESEGVLIVKRLRPNDDIIGTEGNDVIIAALGGKIFSQGGDDTIISLASSEIIDAGEGNNTVYASTTGSLYAGNGNNTITIQGNHTRLGHLRLGDGNNTVVANATYQDVTLSLGNGNNSVSLASLGKYSKLSFGDGDNALSIQTVGSDSDVYFGNGDNNTYINSLSYNSRINIGYLDNTLHSNFGSNAQKNKMHIGSFGYGSNIRLGNGYNDISIDFMDNDSNILSDSKNSNNLIQVKSMNGGNIRLGDGNNSLFLSEMLSGSIELGNGTNSIHLKMMALNSSIMAGSGHTTINAHEMSYGSSVKTEGETNLSVTTARAVNIATGAGNATLIFGSMEGGSIVTGAGNDQLMFGTLVRGSISTGAGNDRLVVNGNIGEQESHAGLKPGESNYSVFVDLGSGNNEFIAKGDVNGLHFSPGFGTGKIDIYGDILNSMIVENGYNLNILGKTTKTQ